MTPTDARGRRALAALNVALTGVLFGVLQWSALFLLQSYLASTAIVYLLSTSVWLLGSLAGLALPGTGGEPIWIVVATLAYYALRALAVAHPYDLRYLPPLLCCIAAMGAYAGRFFRYRRGALGSTRWLFFVENTGFVVGMVATAVALYFTGESFFRVAPLTCAAVCLATALPLGSSARAG